MREAEYTQPPLPPWTTDPRVAALHDALAHVMADAVAVTTLALFAQWNTADGADGGFVDEFRRRARAGRSAQAQVARRMLALGGPVMLHRSDPTEVPRALFAAQSADPFSELALLAAGTYEFVRSVEATVEVAREIPDRPCMGAMRRLQRREERAMARLRELGGAMAEASGPGPRGRVQ